MLRTIVVDDEPFSREVLRIMLTKNCPQVSLLKECENVEQAKEAIEKLKPDLIFLDVEMPTGSGFDLLMEMSEIHFEVIFTTAFDQYAVRAIRFSALDFLLKPLNEEELQHAVVRAEKKRFDIDLRKKLDALVYNLNYMNKEKKIALPTVKGMEFVSVDSIIRCEGENNFTVFHLKNKTNILVTKPIGEYENLLEDYHFLRVHSEHLINLRHIKNYVRGEGGSVTMDDNAVVHVSPRKKEEFMKRMAAI